MKYRGLLSLATIFLLAMLIGCGDGGGESASEAQETPEQKSAGTDISAFTSAVNGTIQFKGDTPERRRIRQDAECGVLHGDEPVLSEDVVVNENGTLKYVFVYVKEGLGDKMFDPPAEPVVFDQKGCMYSPHVFGIQVGQTLKILNSDPLLHNIHALPEDNRPFNFGMPKQGDEREKSFRKPEVMVKIKCDVHPWMLAYAGVVNHPYYSVSGNDGTFSLEHLPPGEYVIEAWHEKYGTQTQNVTVGDGETRSVDFSFGVGASS
jgi:plastocyanin